MSLLEDRIARILELRISDYDVRAIAEELKIGISAVESIEESTKRSIQNSISSGKQNPMDIASELGLSPIIVDMFISHYKIETSELSQFQASNGNNGSTQEQNYRLINQVIENGAKSIDEIMKKTGFKRRHLNRLASSGNITIPGRDYRTKKDKVNYILQASKDGESIEDIAGDLRMTRKTVVRYASEANFNLPGIDYRTREDILNGIRIGAEDGHSADVIAECVGLLRKTVIKYASGIDIRFPGVKYKSNEFDYDTEVNIPRKRHRKTIERIIAIREAYINGAYSIEDVVEITRIKKWIVEDYARYAGINFSVRQREAKERIYAIRQAIANGADSEDAVAEQVGLAKNTIRKYARDADIKFPGKDYRTREEKIAEIQLAKDNGYTSLDSIAIKVRLSESLTYTLIKEGEIDLPEIGLPILPGVVRRPEIDNIINSDPPIPTLQEIGDRFDQSRETIRVYIGHSGQTSLYKEKRELTKQLAKQGKF